MRRLVALITLMLASVAPAAAHNDGCLIAVHAGGVQQHLVCS